MKRIIGVIWILLLSVLPAFAVVSTETTRVAYTCNGVLTSYAYPFKVLADVDLLVIKKATATLVETTLARTTDYTVTGTGSSSGAVVLTAGSKCGSGYTLTILRNIAATQGTDYVDGEAFSAESIENALDKVTMIQQQQKEQIGRAFKLPTTVTITNPVLPNPVANNLIGWNAAGTQLINRTDGITLTTATGYEVDALVTYGGGISYTQATIEDALTAIGTTNKVPLLLRPGSWDISSPLAIPSNVTLNMPPGSYFSFSATGVVTGLTYATPEMFGFVDGVADDVQINWAIKSLSTGGRLFLPKPPYYLAAPISLTAATDVILESIASFNNPGTYTFILATNANSVMIDATSGALNTNITLRNLALQGNKANQNGAGPYVGINLSGTTQNRTTLENIFINGVKGDGIYSTQDEVTFRDIKVQSCTRDGIRLDGAADTYFFNVLCGGNGENGLYMKGSLVYSFGFNSYLNTHDGIHMENGVGSFFVGLEVNDNERNGIHLTTTNASSVCRYNRFAFGLTSDNSQETTNTYSNVLLDGAGFLDNISFDNVKFYDTEDGHAEQPKYLIEDARTNALYSGLPGYGINLSNSVINSGATFTDTAWATAGFLGNASHVNTMDINTGFPVEGISYYTNSLPNATATIAPYGKVMSLTSAHIGATCALTMSETGAYAGQEVKIINPSAASNLTIATVAGVQIISGGPLTLQENDNITLVYTGSIWLQTGYTNN